MLGIERVLNDAGHRETHCHYGNQNPSVLLIQMRYATDAARIRGRAFAGRFRNGIMGRANSSDPAWFRLHPAVEECMKELGR